MINAQYRVMDAASSVLRRDTSCCREGRALFCPNERHFADQRVERKVLRDIAVEDCRDRGWTERGEGIDSLDIRVIQFVDPGKVSDTRGFPCDDLVSPCASGSGGWPFSHALECKGCQPRRRGSPTIIPSKAVG